MYGRGKGRVEKLLSVVIQAESFMVEDVRVIWAVNYAWGHNQSSTCQVSYLIGKVFIDSLQLESSIFSLEDKVFENQTHSFKPAQGILGVAVQFILTRKLLLRNGAHS